MAAENEAWTVLSHQPIEKHSDNFWTVTGLMPDGKTQRVMSIAKLGDGRLLIHNAIALEENLMSEIEAFGTPAVIVVPSGFHRHDAPVFKRRYASAKFLCPKGATKAVASKVQVDGDYTSAPTDVSVSITHLQGTKDREGVLQVKGAHGTALVFNDAINNLTERGGLWGFILAPTGRPCVPRIARWIMVTDKAALRAHLDTLAATPELSRVVMSHGAPITHEPGAALRAVGAELVG